jgi:integrase
VYSCAVNKLKTFVGNSCPFENLTYKKLTEFQDSMLAEQIKVNTISVYMRTIRAVFNRAIREGLIPATCYPFTAYRIKNEKTINRTLTLKEMRSIAKLKLEPGTPIWHWRNYFLLSFCLIGINFADLLTLTGSNLVDGRVVFRRKKTGKVYSIYLHRYADDILSNYVDINSIAKDALLLPVLKQTKDPVKLKTDIWQAIKTCNEYLVRIAKACSCPKAVSTYYGRYAWANLARSLGYSKDVIGQALGHSSYGSNAVTSIYLDDYDNGVIDGANAKVLTAVFKR